MPQMTIWRMRICMLETVCTIYCFSTAAVVARNAPQCYIIRALPVLLNLMRIHLHRRLLPDRVSCTNYEVQTANNGSVQQ